MKRLIAVVLTVVLTLTGCSLSGGAADKSFGKAMDSYRNAKSITGSANVNADGLKITVDFQVAKDTFDVVVKDPQVLSGLEYQVSAEKSTLKFAGLETQISGKDALTAVSAVAAIVQSFMKYTPAEKGLPAGYKASMKDKQVNISYQGDFSFTADFAEDGSTLKNAVIDLGEKNIYLQVTKLEFGK